ncbi:hypothetical protein [Curtobacterium sp. MCJR17_020]|uniref:hypothetical protein n=1 Tax=Curtobacterium sp. MCJR17_020 TaxID=2175619 RepID=UPI000DA85581|nr:hypothetical protein [Curtobacterium sp. MCJR17_020]WIE70799.1 hypothetical protein DEJ14_011330 [Curtobacterium sp. MCJR17_020]
MATSNREFRSGSIHAGLDELKERLGGSLLQQEPDIRIEYDNPRDFSADSSAHVFVTYDYVIPRSDADELLKRAI